MIRTIVILAAISASAMACGQEPEPTMLVIGNSLTGNTFPTKIKEFDVTGHLDGSVGLPFIFANPTAVTYPPCNWKQRWNEVIFDQAFDFVVVQPYLASTIEDNLDIINHFRDWQPNAQFIVHNGWAPHATIDADFHAPFTEEFEFSQAWHDELMAQLQLTIPDVTNTGTHRLLHDVWHDIDAGIGPFDDITDLYSDSLHLNLYGKYGANQALRKASGLDRNDDGWMLVPIEKRDYLADKVYGITGAELHAVPEPSSSLMLACLVILVASRRRTGTANR